MNYEKVFKIFDKQKKNYLNKHELKLAIVYLTGLKPRYEELKKLWSNRLNFKGGI